MEEITIDLKNMIYQICRKWRMVLIGMIIGAIFANLAAIALNIRQASAVEAEMAKQEMEENDLVDVTELREVLSDKEILEVENAAASYVAYMKTNNTQLAYYCDSILMQMDANEVPTLTLQYYIDNYYKAEYPVIETIDNASDIGNALGKYALSAAVCNKVSEKLGWSNDIAYIQDLISYGCSGHSLSIKVIAPESKDCEQISEIIKKQIDEAVVKLQSVYGDFEVKLAMEECIVTASPELLSQQINQLSNIYSGKNDFRTSVANFSGDQKEYYDALIENYFKENNTPVNNIVTSIGEEENEDTVEEKMNIQYIHVKYILLGIFIGLVICVGWLCVHYICSGTLQMNNDIQEGFGLSVIGTVKSEATKKHNVIDNFIEWIFRKKGMQFTQEEQIRMAGAAIRIAAEKNDMKKLYISSAANNEITKQLEKELVSLLKKQGVDVENGVSIVYDPESLERMSNCDGTVLVESTGQSLYKDILTEKRLCEGSHVPIIGVVVIEN